MRLTLPIVVVAASVVAATASRASSAQLPLLPFPASGTGPPSTESEEDALGFRLAHVFHHGTIDYPKLHRRLDVSPSHTVWISDDEESGKVGGASRLIPPLPARRQQASIQRLADRSEERIDDLLAAARWYGEAQDVPPSEWTVDKVSIPNVTDYPTILSMANMAGNAYIEEPNTGEWRDIGSGFNYTLHFGWEKDGIRGHVFTESTNSTVVIALKGTTVAVYDGAGSTTNDKLNDNLFFGCCCGQGSYFTAKYCDCSTEAYKCNSTCVTRALREKNRYYWAAKELYNNVTAIYPGADIWLVGHSLGGSTASLVGLTYGLPVVTFEAPGEAMAAQRLGLPTPPGYRIGDSGENAPSAHSYHFGHNADELFLGQCGELCYIGGYAMESQCHSGHECVYDVQKDLNWGLSLNSHGIQYVINNVLDHYKTAANCTVVTDCNDCFKWKYFKSNGSDGTTTTRSTSTSFTQTRTETCMTPGWWGCLDESTTTSRSSTTTSSATTSTCKTPGWFGCNDPTTTTTTSTSTSTSTSATCVTPGWFGCKDPATSVTTATTPIDSYWRELSSATTGARGPRAPERTKSP